MGKKSFGLITEEQSGIFNRRKIYNLYMQKYYNLYMGAYKITGEDISEDMQEFILRRFWSMGKLSAFIVKGTKASSESEIANVDNYQSGMIAFTDFAPLRYNIMIGQ